MTSEDACALHEAAIESMFHIHPRLRPHRAIVQASYNYLYPFVEQLPVPDALEVIARHAESLLER